MKCCNQQTKRTEIWAQMKIGLTLEAVFGKTIGKKLEKLAKDSDKLKPGRTSESTDLSMFDSVGPCPDKGCNGFAEGFIEGKGGFGAGIKISAKVPLYPTVQAPKFAVTQYTGVMGVEISMGVKGGAVCVFRPGDIFEIF